MPDDDVMIMNDIVAGQIDLMVDASPDCLRAATKSGIVGARGGQEEKAARVSRRSPTRGGPPSMVCRCWPRPPLSRPS
jgi:hypothetical protein